MAGHRSERVGERIHQEISVLLQREISDPRLADVNVTRVTVTGDLRIAKIYVTSRDPSADPKEMMDALTRASGYFRRHLAASMDLRYTPEIRFYFDRSIQAGEHFLQVLEQVQAEQQAAASKPSRRRTKDK